MGKWYNSALHVYTETSDSSGRRLDAESLTAAARSALATAAVHVAQAEERSAALALVAAEVAEQTLTSAETATDTDRLATDVVTREQREAEESEARRQQEIAVAAAAAAEETQKRQQLEQQRQQKQRQAPKQDKTSKTRSEAVPSKKRGSSGSKSQSALQEDVSSWPRLMSVYNVLYAYTCWLLLSRMRNSTELQQKACKKRLKCWK